MNERHGMSKSREYVVWFRMRQRCYRLKETNYKNYGGRGITICDRWKNSFGNFYADMGTRPEGHTLERIDNNGNYCPQNCRWATIREQARNKRTNDNITFNGETMCLADWAVKIGVGRRTLWGRLYVTNWSIEDALSKKRYYRVNK